MSSESAVCFQPHLSPKQMDLSLPSRSFKCENQSENKWVFTLNVTCWVISRLQMVSAWLVKWVVALVSCLLINPKKVLVWLVDRLNGSLCLCLFPPQKAFINTYELSKKLLNSAKLQLYFKYVLRWDWAEAGHKLTVLASKPSPYSQGRLYGGLRGSVRPGAKVRGTYVPLCTRIRLCPLKVLHHHLLPEPSRMRIQWMLCQSGGNGGGRKGRQNLGVKYLVGSINKMSHQC